MTRAELHRTLRARWDTLAPRERRLATVAVLSVLAAMLWWLGLQPALRTLREAPVRINALDMQLAEMQRQAAEAKALANAPALSEAEARKALEAVTARLGAGAQLQLQGTRATLTVSEVSGPALWNWLTEARSAARARPVEAQITLGPKGYSGTVVLDLGGAT